MTWGSFHAACAQAKSYSQGTPNIRAVTRDLYPCEHQETYVPEQLRVGSMARQPTQYLAAYRIH